MLRRVAAVSVLFLSACNGGDSTNTGGGGTSGSSGGSAMLRTYFVQSFAPFEAKATQLRKSARFIRQANRWILGNGIHLDSNPLASARVEYAHAVGLTGAGQTVAISDGGFLTSHEALVGHDITTVGNPGVDSHGTFVASVVAGNSGTMIGVAPEVDLILGPIDDQNDLAATAELAHRRGAVALNNSWGYMIDVSQSSFDAVFSGSDGARYLAALRNYASHGVVVFAISNDDGQRTADIMAALPMIDPSLTNGWIAVGNAVPVYDANRIVSARRVSSRCLEAAAWCMVADGYWEAADSKGDASYSEGTGSSFAAPQVSAALAILAEAFPTLTPHDLRVRLLASADNSWFNYDGSVELAPGYHHSYSRDYGHGFLDLRAALLPIGQTTLSVNGQEMALDEAVVHQGSALGDALEKGLASVSVNVTDSLDAGFGVNGADLALRPEALPLASRVANVPEGHAASPISGFGEFAGSETEMQLADAPVTLRVLTPAAATGSFGLAVTRRFGDEASGLDLGLSLARDGGEVFGLGHGGVGDGTLVAAISLGLDANLGGNGFLRLGAEAGMAQAAGRGVLGNVGRLGVNSFTAEIGTTDVLALGDSLVLGLSAPLTVTSGSATTVLSTLSADGHASVTELSIPLAPTAREQVLALGYDVALSDHAQLRLDLAHAMNWGNRRASQETAAGVTLSFNF